MSDGEEIAGSGGETPAEEAINISEEVLNRFVKHGILEMQWKAVLEDIEKLKELARKYAEEMAQQLGDANPLRVAEVFAELTDVWTAVFEALLYRKVTGGLPDRLEELAEKVRGIWK